MKALTIPALLLALITPFANASDAELIQGCRDAVKIYNAKGELGLAVILDASPAELLGAGYCRGRLEGSFDNWYRTAERVAREDMPRKPDACDLLPDRFCR